MNDTHTETAPSDANDLGEVVIERVFDAPRELVFACMTTPEHLTHFWGPPGMSTPLDTISIDLRVGGIFRSVMVSDETGDRFPGESVFLEVDPPAKLVWRETDPMSQGMTTTSTFTDTGDGRTRVVIHQRGVPAMYRSPEALAGFNASIDRFVTYLAGLRGAQA